MKPILIVLAAVMSWSCAPYVEPGTKSDRGDVIGHRAGIVIRAGDLSASLEELALPPFPAAKPLATTPPVASTAAATRPPAVEPGSPARPSRRMTTGEGKLPHDPHAGAPR